MKRIFFVIIILATINTICFGQIQIKIDSLFHINPITGINGDNLEANSKFIQRMIFTPLVFPLADPYLTDNYDVVLDLSLIEPIIEYKDKKEKDFSKENTYNFKLDKKNPIGQVFKIKLRNNLKFYGYKDKNYEGPPELRNLKPQDVVFSYRLSRITMDRIYKQWNGKDANELHINTLMYSRIKTIDNIYCEKEYIIIEMERPIRCEDFLSYLVYVPILSQNQIISRSETSEFYKSFEKPISFKDIYAIDEKRNPKEYKNYDDYDLKILLKIQGKMDSFYRSPMSCGQYFVYDISPEGLIEDDKFTGIKLERNPYWCNFSDVKDIGGINKTPIISRLDHNKFSKISLRLEINYQTFVGGAWSRIANLKENEILYNQPISSTIFPNYENLKEVSAKYIKDRMHISHRLYGIFFGKYEKFLSPYARKMFFEITDRYKIENVLKYTLKIPNFTDFNNIINPPEDEKIINSMVSNLHIKRLYLPFYNDSDKESDIVNLNKNVENDDSYFSSIRQEMGRERINIEENDSYEKFYLNLKGDQAKQLNFYNKYIQDYRDNKNVILTTLFNQCKNELIDKGAIKVNIYIINNDPVATQIAQQYQKLLQKFFYSQTNNGLSEYSNANIEIKPFDEVDDFKLNLKNWNQIAAQNAKRKIISLLVRGWNFKFDIYDQLAFSNADTEDQLTLIKNSYDKLIQGNSGQAALTLYAEIAERIIGFNSGNTEPNTKITNPIMIPIVSVENYTVYPNSSKIFEATGIGNKLSKEIMLLPYYWEQ